MGGLQRGPRYCFSEEKCEPKTLKFNVSRNFKTGLVNYGLTDVHQVKSRFLKIEVIFFLFWGGCVGGEVLGVRKS